MRSADHFTSLYESSTFNMKCKFTKTTINNRFDFIILKIQQGSMLRILVMNQQNLNSKSVFEHDKN